MRRSGRIPYALVMPLLWFELLGRDFALILVLGERLLVPLQHGTRISYWQHLQQLFGLW